MKKQPWDADLAAESLVNRIAIGFGESFYGDNERKVRQIVEEEYQVALKAWEVTLKWMKVGKVRKPPGFFFAECRKRRGEAMDQARGASGAGLRMVAAAEARLQKGGR